MPKIKPFDEFADKYEEWFDRHPDIFQAELKAIRSIMPSFKKGIEIGAGTGHFTASLGIQDGVEPSKEMAEKAKQKGIRVFAGTAENLPLADKSYDLVLMITTVCFLDDILLSFREVLRILKNGGSFIAGFIDKESELGEKYRKKREKSRFYREAVFLTPEEILKNIKKAGFQAAAVRQILIPEKPPGFIREGFGKGSFVVIKCIKTNSEEA